MKRYVRASRYVNETPYIGYCFYTAGNETWGGEAREILRNLGGCRGYVKLPNPIGTYYRPRNIYMFTDENMYNDFVNELESHDLLGLINLQQYLELPEDAIVIEED